MRKESIKAGWGEGNQKIIYDLGEGRYTNIQVDIYFTSEDLLYQ